MSLISSFLRDQLLKALEEQFVAHSADLQVAFVNEVDAFAGEVLAWAKSKVDSTPQSVE